jgi:hypothetical protein
VEHALGRRLCSLLDVLEFKVGDSWWRFSGDCLSSCAIDTDVRLGMEAYMTDRNIPSEERFNPVETAMLGVELSVNVTSCTAPPQIRIVWGTDGQILFLDMEEARNLFNWLKDALP